MSIDLEAIKARCKAATKGPWKYTYSKEDNEHNVILHGDDYNDDTVLLFYEGCQTGNADAEFIAHAREDVPALVAEVERLTVGIKEIGAMCAKRHDKIKLLEKQLAAAMEERAFLFHLPTGRCLILL